MRLMCATRHIRGDGEDYYNCLRAESSDPEFVVKH